MMVKNSGQSGWWHSKLALVGVGVLIILLTISVIRLINQNRGVNQEIVTLENQLTDLEKANFEFSELIAYLNSTAYLEKKARTDLGLKKEGEQTVLIPTISLSSSAAATTTAALAGPNPVKWWHYFFSR